MKLSGIRISGSFKPVTNPDGKMAVVKDERAVLAKLDLCKRIARRTSKRVRVVSRAGKSINRGA